jgi:hypothetical protein
VPSLREALFPRLNGGSEESAPLSRPAKDWVMKAQRKIIVYLATSADGYIARPDRDVEWLNRRPPTVDYGMTEFYSTIDTVLWGRKTYDWALAYYRKHGRKGEMSTRNLPATCSPGNH